MSSCGAVKWGRWGSVYTKCLQSVWRLISLPARAPSTTNYVCTHESWDFAVWERGYCGIASMSQVLEAAPPRSCDRCQLLRTCCTANREHRAASSKQKEARSEQQNQKSFWWLIKSIMHLKLQVACNTSSCCCNHSSTRSSSCCSLGHTHRPMHNAQRRCIQSNIKACHALIILSHSDAACHFWLFFLIIKWLRTGNNSYAPYAAFTIHQRQPPTRQNATMLPLYFLPLLLLVVL